MKRTYEAYDALLQGEDVEKAYMSAYGWKKSNKSMDDQGKDLLTGNQEFPLVQAKSSLIYARKHLGLSLAFTRKFNKNSFIPLCIGEPAKDANEVFDSIRKFGAYISPDVSGDVSGFLDFVAKVRDLCYNPSRLNGVLTNPEEMAKLQAELSM